MDEIKALRESNKNKETNLHDESRELERMEGKVRETMASAAADKEKEQQLAERKKAGKAGEAALQVCGREGYRDRQREREDGDSETEIERRRG